MGLERFEHRLERLVEGAFAKAFRGELQPIELGRKLTREMDLRRTVSVRGLVAPNFFSVLLSREDFQRMGSIVEAVARELVDAAGEHAQAERYVFLGPVEVEIGWSKDLQRSTFAISAEVRESDQQAGAVLVLGDGSTLEIGEEPVTIGRLSECDISIEDPNVSRRHAEIRRDGDGFRLVDLGSTNGTRVNGLPVRDHVLASGDVVTVGVTSVRFETV